MRNKVIIVLLCLTAFLGGGFTVHQFLLAPETPLSELSPPLTWPCGGEAKPVQQSEETRLPQEKDTTMTSRESMEDLVVKMASKYKEKTPAGWGEYITGVITRLPTGAMVEKVIALTFDACGGPSGSGYDAELLDFLALEKIPATLFVNGRWIDANPGIFRELAQNPLFEIENHGFQHKPLSVNGKTAYKTRGTANIAEVVKEVELNARKIEDLTGRKPKYFRSGTAYYDEVAVLIVRDLGYQAVNFSVIGDAGATFSAEQIRKACRGVKPGDIIIFHMNHPEGATAKGVKSAVRELKDRGFAFVKLEDYLSVF